MSYFMVWLFLAVLLGVAFAIFASFNTRLVDINFFDYLISDIPLYMVMLVPMLLGISVSFIIYLIRTLSSDLTISEHKSNIKELKSEVAELTKQSHKLELENTKLKAEVGEFDEESI